MKPDEKTAWGKIFDREPVAMKSDRTDPAIENILLEPVREDIYEYIVNA